MLESRREKDAIGNEIIYLDLDDFGILPAVINNGLVYLLPQIKVTEDIITKEIINIDVINKCTQIVLGQCSNPIRDFSFKDTILPCLPEQLIFVLQDYFGKVTEVDTDPKFRCICEHLETITQLLKNEYEVQE